MLFSKKDEMPSPTDYFRIPNSQRGENNDSEKIDEEAFQNSDSSSDTDSVISQNISKKGKSNNNTDRRKKSQLHTNLIKIKKVEIQQDAKTSSKSDRGNQKIIN